MGGSSARQRGLGALAARLEGRGARLGGSRVARGASPDRRATGDDEGIGGSPGWLVAEVGATGRAGPRCAPDAERRGLGAPRERSEGRLDGRRWPRAACGGRRGSRPTAAGQPSARSWCGAGRPPWARCIRASGRSGGVGLVWAAAAGRWRGGQQMQSSRPRRVRAGPGHSWRDLLPRARYRAHAGSSGVSRLPASDPDVPPCECATWEVSRVFGPDLRELIVAARRYA